VQRFLHYGQQFMARLVNRNFDFNQTDEALTIAFSNAAMRLRKAWFGIFSGAFARSAPAPTAALKRT
jgi:hypothetical protein